MNVPINIKSLLFDSFESTDASCGPVCVGHIGGCGRILLCFTVLTPAVDAQNLNLTPCKM